MPLKVTTLVEKPALKMILLLISVTTVWSSEEVDAIIVPEKLQVEESEYVQLKCLTTTDIYDVYWTMAQDAPLSQHVETRGSILIIKEARINDNGEYICHSSSHHGGQSKTSSYLTVTDKTTAFITPSELVAEVGDIIELKCEGTGDKYNLFWTLKDNMPLPNYVKTIGQSLQIFSVTKRDDSVYVCHVHSTTGAVNISAKITVNDKTTAEIKPKLLEIEEGQVGEFTCEATGDSLRLYWDTDSKIAFSYVSVYGNRSVLTVNNTSAGDKVKVHCKVLTTTGKAQSTASLIVREKTTSTIIPKERIAEIGDTVKFYCQGTGHQYRMKWTLVGHKPLPPHINIKGPVLEISSVTLGDSSMYVCHLQSSTGISESSAKLTVKGNMTQQQGHIFNFHKVQYQPRDATSEKVNELIAHNDPHPLYVRLLVIFSGLVACVFAFLLGFLMYGKYRKRKVKLVVMESLESVKSKFQPRRHFKRIHRKSRNKVHPMALSECSIVKSPYFVQPISRARTAPPALQPKCTVKKTDEVCQKSPSQSSNYLSITVPEVLSSDWSISQGYTISNTTFSSAQNFPYTKSPELIRLPHLNPQDLIELPGTATMDTTLNKLDESNTTEAKSRGSNVPNLCKPPCSDSNKLVSPKTKYGYIGFGPTGVYRGIFEVNSAIQFVPSLAALAMETVKKSSIVNTPSGLSFVPSTANHSSILEKRGQLEFVPSKKLATSTSVPSLVEFSPGNNVKKNNSSVDLPGEVGANKLVGIDQLVGIDDRKKRKVCFYDQYVLGCSGSDSPSCTHADEQRKGSLPRKSSLARKAGDSINHCH